MDLRLTDDFTGLVLHVLAHVPLSEPGTLYDPRYVAWAAETTPAPEARWLREGVAVWRRAWAEGAPPVVHAWPELFGSIEALRSVATHELGSLRPPQVRAPWVLAQAQARAGDDLELLHATLCALAPWYARWWVRTLAPRRRETLDPVRRGLDEALSRVPALAGVPVELAWSLGGRGRAFPGRTVVGAPAGWNGLDARIPAVLAMHEHLVRDEGHGGYLDAEWSALTGLAARMRGASAPMRAAHRQWLATLQLDPLLDGLLAAGRLEPPEHERLRHDPEGRASRLAALAG